MWNVVDKGDDGVVVNDSKKNTDEHHAHITITIM